MPWLIKYDTEYINISLDRAYDNHPPNDSQAKWTGAGPKNKVEQKQAKNSFHLCLYSKPAN